MQKHFKKHFILKLKKKLKLKDKWKKSSYITGVILLLAVVQMAMIFDGVWLQKSSAETLQEAYSNQITYRTLAYDLRKYSDYLTNEVRKFAVTQDLQYFENYWDEVKHQMHREKIIAQIEAADIPASEEHSLELAKYYSDTLMHIEISSMRLTLETMDLTKYDEEDQEREESGDNEKNVFLSECIRYVKNYPLESDYQFDDSEIENGLASKLKDNKRNMEKIHKAELILYGSAYDTYKGLIDTNIEKFQTALNTRLAREVLIARRKSKQAVFLQIFFGIGEIAVLVLILVIFQRWYIKPVIRYKKMIEHQHGRRKMFVEPEGVWELQEFAKEFNALSADMLSELVKSEKIEQELMDAKRQAEKANQVKTQFLTQMSHELRTPLSTISGYLFLLEDTRMSGEQRRYVENIRLAADVLLEEINEILDYSKLESGRMTFENKNFNLRHLTDTLKAILENEAEQRNLTFIIEIDESVPEYVYGDPLKLKQVLTNLIYNGFKFTKEGGVTLSIKSLHFSTKQCVLEFSVKDTGIGVKKEQRQKIFDAFAQADASITRKYGGTGLGLPICRKIVQEMSKGKYTLLLESEEGVGSTFYFDMDFEYGKEEKKRKKETLSDKRSKRSLSILIVDDNKVNRILEAEVLHKFGYIADTEGDPEAVIDRMHKTAYDIVFLDISMPKISGYELSMQIRKDAAFQNTIIIALTANIGEDVIKKVKEAGMNDYLPKPIPMEQLKALLEAYTAQTIYTLPKTQMIETAAKTDELIAFKGLEDQFYGDKEAVAELLTIFMEDNVSFCESLKENIGRSDWEAAEMQVHRIKGVSGNLMCYPLEAAAKMCLMDIKKNKWNEAHGEQLVLVFEQTMKEVNVYVSDFNCRR